MARQAVKKIDTADAETRYTKAQLVCSVRYREQRDILEALLAQDAVYTAGEVDGLINQYRKGQVV